MDLFNYLVLSTILICEVVVLVFTLVSGPEARFYFYASQITKSRRKQHNIDLAKALESVTDPDDKESLNYIENAVLVYHLAVFFGIFAWLFIREDNPLFVIVSLIVLFGWIKEFLSGKFFYKHNMLETIHIVDFVLTLILLTIGYITLAF